MDRRRHRARRQAARRDQRHPRTDDARARPPSRAGARRRRHATARRAAAGQFGASATWRARLDEHLGNYAVEAAQSARRPVSCRRRMPCTASPIWRRCAACLPERDPHAAIYDALETILDGLDDPRRRRAVDRALRAGAFWPSSASASISRPAPQPGDHGRSHLRVAAIGPRGLARRRRAVSRQAVAAAAFLHEAEAMTAADLADGFRADRIFPRAPRLRAARAGSAGCARAFRDAATRSFPGAATAAT